MTYAEYRAFRINSTPEMDMPHKFPRKRVLMFGTKMNGTYRKAGVILNVRLVQNWFTVRQSQQDRRHGMAIYDDETDVTAAPLPNQLVTPN